MMACAATKRGWPDRAERKAKRARKLQEDNDACCEVREQAAAATWASDMTTADGHNHTEAHMTSAIDDGWAIGICGLATRQAKQEGAETGARWVDCDFLTEYIAPGGGKGVKGAGTRLMEKVIETNGEGIDERAVHGHIRKNNTTGRMFWDAMGMTTNLAGDDNTGWKEGRIWQTRDNKGEWGYMRGNWQTIAAQTAARATEHQKGPRPRQYTMTYHTIEEMKRSSTI